MSVFTATAPGRAELLGNHTDYNQGLVMAIAVDKSVTVTGRLRDDDRIILRSKDIDQPVESSLSKLQPFDRGAWANYPLGVVDELRKRGVALKGFELEVSGTIPMGAGLSSSAALEVATALFLQKALGYQADRMELAKICQAAENNFVGVKCGLLDQISSLFGRQDHAVLIDCRTLEVSPIPLGTGTLFIIAHTNVKHALTGGEYNALRDACFDAARVMGVSYLRDATFELLHQKIPDSGSVSRRRATHIIGENQRVSEGVGYLREGKVRDFGLLMFASHESSRDQFENSCPELDVLVDAARKIRGCLGARLSGGGFGGATINLVEESRAGDFMKELHEAYQRQTGIQPNIFPCRASHGAV